MYKRQANCIWYVYIYCRIMPQGLKEAGALQNKRIAITVHLKVKRKGSPNPLCSGS